MNPYILGGGVAIIAIMGLLLKNSYERNGELEAKLETQANETLECTDANDTNQDTITELEAKVADLTALRADEAAARELVLVERSQQLAAALARAAELEQERLEEVFENEDCRDLSELRVDVFCPATAGQLRQRSRGPGSN